MVGIGGGGFGFEGGFGDFVGHGIDETDGGGVDAGSGADAGENLLDEDDGLVGSGKTEFGEIEAEGEDVVWVEAEVHVEELGEAAKGESGADQEDGGEGDFGDDEGLAKVVVGSGGLVLGGVEGEE